MKIEIRADKTLRCWTGNWACPPTAWVPDTATKEGTAWIACGVDREAECVDPHDRDQGPRGKHDQIATSGQGQEPPDHEAADG